MPYYDATINVRLHTITVYKAPDGKTYAFGTPDVYQRGPYSDYDIARAEVWCRHHDVEFIDERGIDRVRLKAEREIYFINRWE